jgi:hypothetical protein
MARRRIKNGFRKQERTGRLRTRLNDIVVEALGINHTSVGDRED